MHRDVQPEILDSLPAADPAARRSRRDLRLINALMGNHRWLRRRAAGERCVELGAGDGALARALAGRGAEVEALDLAPPPADLPGRVRWRRGDLFESLPEARGETVIACLILHHFTAPLLARLGEAIEQGGARRVLAAEPHRSRLALVEGRLLFPLVNTVTRHDMIVSIRAGFRRGELAAALGLDRSRWRIVESTTALGALRFEACRT